MSSGGGSSKSKISPKNPFMMPPPTGGISTGGMPGCTKGKSKSWPWGAGSVLKKAKQAIKDFVYKMCLIDWSSKLSLCIPEETMGIITILMPPGSTVHDLKEKIMQWLEEISKEYGWNPPEGQLTILTGAGEGAAPAHVKED